MAINRLNYFKGEFLEEKDFTDEQKYHIGMLRLHNKNLHTWGIADGLDVTFVVGEKKVTIHEGMAIDADGKQIVLNEAKDIDFSASTAKNPICITIAYNDDTLADSRTDTGITGFARRVEDPDIQYPDEPTDASRKLILAEVTLNNDKTIGNVDKSKKTSAGVVAGDLEVNSIAFTLAGTDKSLWPKIKTNTGKLEIDSHNGILINSSENDFSGSLKATAFIGNGSAITGLSHNNLINILPANTTSNDTSVTKHVSDMLTKGWQDHVNITSGNPHGTTAAQVGALTSVKGVSSPGGNIDLNQGNSITITSDNVNKKITLGETHSASTNNPHGTTAAQIDTVGGTNKIVDQINAGSGTLSQSRIDSAIARSSDLQQKLNGGFFQGLVIIPSTGSQWINVTSQNLTNRIVAVRGWASTIAEGAPGLLALTYQRWSPLPTNFREGWAITTSAGGVSFPIFFSFVEGIGSIFIQLTISGGGMSFGIIGPAGTKVGYAFQVTWQ